jgi:hypothetical protein
MPTYTWRCQQCDCEIEAFMTIREYCQSPPNFVHCNESMVRRLLPTMLMHTNDDAYAGLRASDGTDISSRTKHRAYMKARNLATMDDFTEQWKRDARERRQRMAGAPDPTLKQDIVQAITQLEANHGRPTQPRRELDPVGTQQGLDDLGQPRAGWT